MTAFAIYTDCNPKRSGFPFISNHIAYIGDSLDDAMDKAVEIRDFLMENGFELVHTYGHDYDKVQMEYVLKGKRKWNTQEHYIYIQAYVDYDI